MLLACFSVLKNFDEPWAMMKSNDVSLVSECATLGAHVWELMADVRTSGLRLKSTISIQPGDQKQFQLLSRSAFCVCSIAGSRLHQVKCRASWPAREFGFEDICVEERVKCFRFRFPRLSELGLLLLLLFGEGQRRLQIL